MQASTRPLVTDTQWPGGFFNCIKGQWESAGQGIYFFIELRFVGREDRDLQVALLAVHSNTGVTLGL